MIALILAAGYGRRLYPLTLNKPKALLYIAGAPLINYIIEELKEIKLIDEIIIVTNQRFYDQFIVWIKDSKTKKYDIKIDILNDGTTSEQNKLGAVKDIDLVTGQIGVKDDLLVIAGDNLIGKGLLDFLNFSKSKAPSSTIGIYAMKDIFRLKQYGCVEIDDASKITRFGEKCIKPLSNLVAMCLYYLSSQHLTAIKTYINEGNNLDAPGHFIKWLAAKDSVYGYRFNGAWFDIGDIASYKEATKKFKVLSQDE